MIEMQSMRKGKRLAAVAFVLISFLSDPSPAWSQCAPGVPCAGNPMGIPPNQPDSPYSIDGSYGSLPPGQQEPSSAPALWASYAIDEQGRLGWSINQRSDTAAARDARSSCEGAGGRGCRIVDTFSEACGAVAVDMGRNTYMGYGGAPNDAQRYAVEKCDAANPTGRCHLATLALCTGANWSGNGYSATLSHKAAEATGEQLAELTAGYRESRPFWGAFAVGPADDAVHSALDETSRKDAEAHAMARCRGGGCRVLGSFENTCAAIGYPTDPARNDEYLSLETGKDPEALARSLRAKCDASYGKRCAVMVRCTGARYRESVPVLDAAPATDQPSAPVPAPPAGASLAHPSYEACLDASGGVTAAVNNCIGIEFDYQDRRLNEAYRALRGTLDASRMSALRAEQRRWIVSRDTSCAPRKDGGTAAMLDSNACLVDRTSERSNELERMLQDRANPQGIQRP